MQPDPGPPPVRSREAPRFGYFLVQTHVAALDETTLVRLTVEDLSSGERRVFDSIRDLCHFLGQRLEPRGEAKWAPPPNA
jgi:hypothetical protein